MGDSQNIIKWFRDMKAFEIKTNRSDYPFLVIADGFKKAVEMLYQKGIYDTDIINVQRD